ncbi:MAG: rhodanese-like domain-containing protein [Ferroplasma sp.]|uniref:rhodanese-like domain-containing protein n=1 Tax=Ferroplasma sp. TaxID=2591003 RepID=UPI002814CA61|nr:rhodanese-like domain-containing protein [Ferroplasma sp.]WMT51116.1 MAG: rhodanese-like domain-containing protein [Ferroplasma sp.]
MGIKDYFRGADYFNQPDELKNLSPEQLLELKEKYSVVDVRTGFEYRHGHIKGAVHYKLGNEDEIEKKFPREEPIILVCKTGHRSRAAANRLVRKGYTKLYHLEGGMNKWRAEKLPEEK